MGFIKKDILRLLIDEIYMSSLSQILDYNRTLNGFYGEVLIGRLSKLPNDKIGIKSFMPTKSKIKKDVYEIEVQISSKLYGILDDGLFVPLRVHKYFKQDVYTLVDAEYIFDYIRPGRGSLELVVAYESLKGAGPDDESLQSIFDSKYLYGSIIQYFDRGLLDVSKIFEDTDNYDYWIFINIWILRIVGNTSDHRLKGYLISRIRDCYSLLAGEIQASIGESRKAKKINFEGINYIFPENHWIFIDLFKEFEKISKMELKFSKNVISLRLINEALKDLVKYIPIFSIVITAVSLMFFVHGLQYDFRTLGIIAGTIKIDSITIFIAMLLVPLIVVPSVLIASFVLAVNSSSLARWRGISMRTSIYRHIASMNGVDLLKFRKAYKSLSLKKNITVIFPLLFILLVTTIIIFVTPGSLIIFSVLISLVLLLSFLIYWGKVDFSLSQRTEGDLRRLFLAIALIFSIPSLYIFYWQNLGYQKICNFVISEGNLKYFQYIETGTWDKSSDILLISYTDNEIYKNIDTVYKSAKIPGVGDVPLRSIVNVPKTSLPPQTACPTRDMYVNEDTDLKSYAKELAHRGILFREVSVGGVSIYELVGSNEVDRELDGESSK